MAVDSAISSPLGPPACEKDAKALRFIEEMTRNADSVQERVLSDILTQNSQTEYLRRFKLNRATDRDSFKSKLPVIAYEDLQPEIQRIANGDRSAILSAHPISEFLTSSGTSAGERKLMPTIKEELDRRQLLYSLLMPVMNLYVPGLDKGKGLYFLFVKSETRTPGGLLARPVLTSYYKSEHFKCLIVLSLKEGYATAEAESHTIHVASLLPSSVCTPPATAKGLDKKSSLQVIHKHGPCSQPHEEKANIPTHVQILLLDEVRVKSIHSKLAKNLGSVNVMKKDAAANLPAKDGSVVGSGNYIVTMGLGTPKKNLRLIFDTGSDITWTQCQPCLRSCYKQQDPIFSPSSSSTYSNVSCSSAACTSLNSATGNSPGCSSSTCVYGIQYGDSSFSIGLFAKEKLTLTSNVVFDNFLFGCGQNNQGLFGGAAGLLGLGRNKLSFPSQTAIKFKKIFSYCLPSSPSSTGFLKFGNDGLSKSVKFTTLSTISGGESFYGITIIAMSVGGKKLLISASILAAGGAIIDSGTVITRLPPTAYSALRSAFRKQMNQYPMAKPLSILDTCYDFSKYSTVSIPKISLFFEKGVEVPIDARGILYVNSISQVCLAFAGNTNDFDVLIYGNTQQKTLEVVYDGTRRMIGFRTGGCT